MREAENETTGTGSSGDSIGNAATSSSSCSRTETVTRAVASIRESLSDVTNAAATNALIIMPPVPIMGLLQQQQQQPQQQQPQPASATSAAAHNASAEPIPADKSGGTCSCARGGGGASGSGSGSGGGVGGVKYGSDRHMFSERRCISSLQNVCAVLAALDTDAACEVAGCTARDCSLALVALADSLPRPFGTTSISGGSDRKAESSETLELLKRSAITTEVGKWLLVALSEVVGCGGAQDEESGEYECSFCEAVGDEVCANVLRISLSAVVDCDTLQRLNKARGKTDGDESIEDILAPALSTIVGIIGGKGQGTWSKGILDLLSDVKYILPLVTIAASARANVDFFSTWGQLMFLLALLGINSTVHRLTFLNYLTTDKMVLAADGSTTIEGPATGSSVIKCSCPPCKTYQHMQNNVEEAWQPEPLRCMVLQGGIIAVLLQLLQSLHSDQDFVWNAVGVLCACAKDSVCREKMQDCSVIPFLMSMMQHACSASTKSCSAPSTDLKRTPSTNFVRLRIDWRAALYCLQWLCLPESIAQETEASRQPAISNRPLSPIVYSMRSAVRSQVTAWKSVFTAFLSLTQAQSSGHLDIDSLSALIEFSLLLSSSTTQTSSQPEPLPTTNTTSLSSTATTNAAASQEATTSPQISSNTTNIDSKQLHSILISLICDYDIIDVTLSGLELHSEKASNTTQWAVQGCALLCHLGHSILDWATEVELQQQQQAQQPIPNNSGNRGNTNKRGKNRNKRNNPRQGCERTGNMPEPVAMSQSLLVILKQKLSSSRIAKTAEKLTTAAPNCMLLVYWLSHLLSLCKKLREHTDRILQEQQNSTTNTKKSNNKRRGKKRS
ncbi:hypothetical protein Pelo_5472 [Pelomyxa schiedti]|nr:hypothetical protein Pelo_5472 [Pelomyxa schiedti]